LEAGDEATMYNNFSSITCVGHDDDDENGTFAYAKEEHLIH